MTQDDIYSLQDYTTGNGTLTLETDEGTPQSTPVALVQDVEITLTSSHEDLFTADSTKREDVLRHSQMVNVSIGFVGWDGEFAKQVLGGSGGTSGTSLADDSSPQRFMLTATFPSRNNANEIDVTVEGITFEEIPLFSGSSGEFTTWEIEGTGEDVTTYDVATPA